MTILNTKKTQNVTKLIISKCDITQKPKLWQNSKTQNVTTKKLKMWQLRNSKCDKTQKLNVTKLEKLKMFQNSQTPNVTTLTNSKCD